MKIKHKWPALLAGLLFATQGAIGQGCDTPRLAGVHPIGPTMVNPQWSASPGQVFELHYRQLGVVEWSSVPDIGVSNYTGSYALSELSPSTSYQYRVRRVCGPNNVSDFSEIRQFETAACLPPTNIKYLSSNLGSEAINLGWTNDNLNGFEYATTSYAYRWRTTGADWQQGSSVFKSCVIDGLTPATPYEVQVQTVCGTTDQRSAFSPSYTFNTQNCPAYILNTVPRRGITTVRILNSFEFGSGKGSYSFDSYLFQWRRSFTNESWQEKRLTGYLNAVEGLAPGTSYEYRILLGCGTVSQQNPSYFTTEACENFVNRLASRPSVSIAPGIVQFRWETNSTTELMQLVLRYREVGTQGWIYHPDVEASSVSFYSPLTLNDLKSNTNYEWQMATRCGEDLTSSYTDSDQFLTGTEPEGGINYTNYAHYWSTAGAWSLGRVPNRQDIVELRHPILIPIKYTAQGGTLRMNALGRIFFDPQGGTRLMVGSPQ